MQERTESGAGGDVPGWMAEKRPRSLSSLLNTPPAEQGKASNTPARRSKTPAAKQVIPPAKQDSRTTIPELREDLFIEADPGGYWVRSEDDLIWDDVYVPNEPQAERADTETPEPSEREPEQQM